MENYVSKYEQIGMSETDIGLVYNNSSITIYFNPEYELGYFPYYPERGAYLQAISLGGLDWAYTAWDRDSAMPCIPVQKQPDRSLPVTITINYTSMPKSCATASGTNPRVQDLEIRGQTAGNRTVCMNL